jgi:phenylalanyl-tRNA synthetase beta chain
MRVSLSWLREYVDLVIPTEDLSQKLTQAGLEVKGVEVVGGSWDSVRVGRVVEVQPHPNADRLRLVTVDAGDRRQTVVCGAPNVAAGQMIAFASVGATLIDGHGGQMSTLKPAKIRGVVSEGMVCSEKELGMSDNHEGILVLPGDAPLGKPLRDYLGDTVLDIEVTPNRPDWMSVLGIAHEVAALTGQNVRMPSLSFREGDTSVSALARVDIMAPDLCGRYCASVIRGIKIGPSPRWMQRRLEACGMRPINNVVDVTNYVMLEFGQPLHAFDYERILGGHIVVRRAAQGERIYSLDGVSRELGSDMLVIADEGRAVAVAGVMGGLNSEVSESTTTVLLECANFNHASIRTTAGALAMRSEASTRFEKGLPPELTVPALLRATQLIIETGGGEAAHGFVDVYPDSKQRRAIVLLCGEVERLLGMTVSSESIRHVLEPLGFSCESMGENGLAVNVPYWRSDIGQSVDLVEEVARIIGYDKMPTTMISGSIPEYQPAPVRVLREKLRTVLIASGLQEVVNYSLTNVESLKKTSRDGSLPGPSPLMISNPMSKDLECLRTSLRPRLLSNVAANQRFEDSIGLFEIGRVFFPRTNSLPDEIEMLGLMLAGRREQVSWRTQERRVDFFDAKGVVEGIMGCAGVQVRFAPGDDPLMMQGRCATIVAGHEELGVVGEVHLRVTDNFRATGPLYFAEMRLDKLLASASGEFKYEPLPRFPSTLRDLALVVDARVRYQDLLDVVKGFPLVDEVTLFDVFEGGQVPSGKKSLAFRVTYRSADHTLTDQEVNGVQQQMLESLSQKFGAALRT